MAIDSISDEHTFKLLAWGPIKLFLWKQKLNTGIQAFCIKCEKETRNHKKFRKEKEIGLQREENPFGGDFYSSVCSRQTKWTRLGSALAASCSAFFAHFAPLLFLQFGLVRIAGCYLKIYQVSFLAGMGKKDDPKLMQEWFKLVQEKNALVRYESELMILWVNVQIFKRGIMLQMVLEDLSVLSPL